MPTFTAYAHARAIRPALVEAFKDTEDGWAELAESIEAMAQVEADDKKAMGSLAPHVLGTGETRAVASVRHVTAIMLDVDAEFIPAEVFEHLSKSGLAWIVYESPSSTADAPRWRVIVRVSREIEVSECYRTRFAMAELLGLAPGCGVAGAKDAAKLFFCGRLTGTPTRQVWSSWGEAVPVDWLLDLPLEHTWGKTKAGTTSIVATSAPSDVPASPEGLAIAAEVPASVSGAGGDDALFHAANEVCKACEGDAGATATALLDEFNPRCSPPWPAERIRRQAGRAGELWAKPEAQFQRRHEVRLTAERVEATGIGIDPHELSLDNTRQGTPRPTISNVAAVLGYTVGEQIRYDDFRGRVVCADIDPSLGDFPDGLWKDVHSTRGVMLCDSMGLYVRTDMFNKALTHHAYAHAFNPVRDWLMQASHRWDGKPRVDRALETYWGSTDSPAIRAMSRVFLLALVARGIEPGEKVDTCTILIGQQGARKSTSLEVLAGGPDLFSDSPLPIGDKEAAQQIRGKWLWEIQELASLSRNDMNSTKAFLSQRHDTYRASYGHFTEDVMRTCVFVATSNESAILRDPSGDRRYLPATIGTIDIEGLRRDREQLLGEATRRVLAGEQHWETDAEEIVVNQVRGAHYDADAWETPIRQWLTERGDVACTIDQLFDAASGAIRLGHAHVDKRAQMRGANVLRRLGYARQRVWAGSHRGQVLWVQGSRPLP